MWQKLLLIAVKQLLGSSVFKIIGDIVLEAANMQIPNAEKKAYVDGKIAELRTEAGSLLAKISKNYINLAIEVAVATLPAL